MNSGVLGHEAYTESPGSAVLHRCTPSQRPSVLLDSNSTKAPPTAAARATRSHTHHGRTLVW